jgi:ParB family chromosome partitioning protein
MNKSNINLGRSISDLLEENKTEFHRNEEVMEIPVGDISSNPEQPRTYFDKSALNELAVSIKEHGVIQPVILKPAGNNKYILVAGERRVMASKIAGLKTIPGIVRNYNSVHLSEIAILENIQREDLSPVEEAIALQNALVKLNLTHEQLSKKIGKSRSYVTNSVGLLNLPGIIINDVNLGKLSMGHARVLSKVKNQELCMKLYKRILKEDLTVRELELIVREINMKREAYIISNKEIEEIQVVLSEKLPNGTKCRVRKNKVEFIFETKEELSKIMEIIVGEEDE